MILLDADVLIMDLRYLRDPKHAVNRSALDRIRLDGFVAGFTSQVMLEVVGILSFNTPLAKVSQLPDYLMAQYGLVVVPDPQTEPRYAACLVSDVLAQIGRQMSLGDAVQAVQIERFAPTASVLLTWNARHFTGKIAIPVMKPDDWLAQLPP